MSTSQALAYAVELENPSREFSAAYMDLRNLRGILDRNPDHADMRVVESVAALIMEQRYSNQKMSRLLYRECGKVLSAAGFGCKDPEVSRRSLHLLVQAASSCSGPASIEASGGLGTLPFDTPGHASPPEYEGSCPEIGLAELAGSAGAKGDPVFSGRSAVFATEKPDEVFVIKFARAVEEPQSLHLEGEWMDRALSFAGESAVRFDCPRPFRVSSRVLFRVANMNVHNSCNLPDNLHESGYAMAYRAHREYFSYPNDHREGCRCSFEEFIEVMGRNCFLLGRMAGQGVMHEAPIPLFHNRVQAMRRTDEGVYQWHLFGRLDRWLESCEYPNFGLSGLRDFEHMQIMKPGKDGFYRCVGSHFLSILLVAGSWFRARDMNVRGLDERGEPIDARHLFDEKRFAEIIRTCFENYHLGFCGRRFNGEIELHIPELVERMIDEMGVDRYMNEFMRVADQNILTDAEFRDYIVSCGVPESEACSIIKGERDVPLITGPHLGDFNRAISLPEIVEWSAMAAGCCIAARSLGDRWG